MLSRHVFPIDTDTGIQTLTGGPFNGAVHQIHWAPETGDTGGDLQVYLRNDANDTGKDITILDDNDSLGANKTWAPRQPQHGVDGNPDPADTGAAFGVPVVSAAQDIRVRVIPGGAAVVGNLYITVG